MMEGGPPLETIAGFPTYVSRVGSGVRRALMIHCSQGHSGNWTGVEAALLDKLKMTTFDRPSHGRSAAWTGGRDGKGIHDLTTEIAGRLIDKRADVIGHSYGATVALRLAMEWPDQVRSLVMIEPVLFAAIRDLPVFAEVQGLMDHLAGLLDAGDNLAAAEAFFRAVEPAGDFGALSDNQQARLAASVVNVVEECGATIYDEAGLLAPGRLEKIRQPVLLLESTSPPRGVREVHEALCARIPQAQRVIVVGAGHMLPITHPENVAGEIAAFLKI